MKKQIESVLLHPWTVCYFFNKVLTEHQEGIMKSNQQHYHLYRI